MTTMGEPGRPLPDPHHRRDVRPERVTRLGAPLRTPVLLLDSPSSPPEELDAVVDLLDEVATVHRFRPQRRDPGIAGHVADIEELRVSWGHDRMVLIGHSLGAVLALAYAGTHPRRAASVGYLSGVGIGGVGIGGVGNDGRGLHERSLVFSDADLIGWAVHAGCPVHFIHGTADPQPLESIVRLASEAPRARKRAVQGGDRTPWVEQPDEVRELLLELFRGVDAAGPAG